MAGHEDGTTGEVEHRRPLGAAAEAMAGGPAPMPLLVLLGALQDWIEDRHLAHVAAAGFDDVRRSHNAVFANLPGSGTRLTDLATRAGISKQAMGEAVTDLEDRGYVRRVPDPDDGRAKLIVWAERGLAAHDVTLQAFDDIEAELARLADPEAVASLRAALQTLFHDVVLPVDPPPPG